MCMEDIKLGRSLASGTKVMTAPNGVDTPAIGADPRRTRITFSTCGAAMRVAPEGVSAAQDGAFSVIGSTQPLVFTVEEYGGLVERPWSVAGVAGDVLCLITMHTLERQN